MGELVIGERLIREDGTWVKKPLPDPPHIGSVISIDDRWVQIADGQSVWRVPREEIQFDG